MDSVYLNGSEDVSRAGTAMREAAREMQSAASALSHAFEQHQRFMDDWLLRAETAMQKQPSIFDQVFGSRGR